MTATTFRRSKRQPALRMLAQEFTESSLQQQGSGEFDPAFVVTKLGAKTNRLVAMGLLENMEHREAGTGPFWTGRIRDASGLHFFSIGTFQPEDIQVQADELLALYQKGEPVLLMMIAKATMRAADDGAIYTGLRPESISIIDSELYAHLLIDACASTLRRIDAYRNSAGVEANEEEFEKAGVPSDLIDGLLLSHGHYGSVDTEVNRLAVLRALDIAEGKEHQASFETADVTERSSSSKKDGKEVEGADIEGWIIECVKAADPDQGADFECLVKYCLERGSDREACETIIESMCEAGTLFEHRWGWFRQVED